MPNNDIIRITFRPGVIDRAWTKVDGRAFEATSGSGAIYALCRELVAAGIPDGPFEATPEGRDKATLTGLSIHLAARYTIHETERDGLRQVPWRPRLAPAEGPRMRPAA